jgi:hypothetical protein
MTTQTTRRRHAALRGPTAYSDNTVKVDADAGIIYNAALLTEGDARGHPFQIGASTVAELVALVNGAPDGVRSRFRHPAVKTKSDPDGRIIQEVADDTGTMVGRIKNARMGTMVQDDGKSVAQARGDVYLGQYGSLLPGQGDVRGYLLAIAQDDPGAIGLSAFFPYEVEPSMDAYGNLTGKPVARMMGLDSIDFVSVPAANQHGLLSAKPAAMFDPQPEFPDSSGWSEANPQDLATAPIPDDPEGVYCDDGIMDDLSALDDDQLGLLLDIGDLAAGEGDSLDSNAEDADLANEIMSRLSPRGVALFRTVDALGKSANKSSIYSAAKALHLARRQALPARMPDPPGSDPGRPPRPGPRPGFSSGGKRLSVK